MTGSTLREALHDLAQEADTDPPLYDAAVRVAAGRRRRRLATAGGAVVLGAAVLVGPALVWPGAFSSIPGFADASPSGIDRLGPVPLVEPTECGDVSLCAAGFYLGDGFFSVDCGAVRPQVVSDRVVAAGTYDGKETEVREIFGVGPDVLLAIRHDGGLCDETRVEPTSPWSIVVPAEQHDDEALHAAICVAVMPEDRALNGCSGQQE